MAIGDERHTGADAIIKVDGEEVPVTNVTWDRDVGTTNVQHSNTSATTTNPLKPTKVITSLDYSGSFEYDGRNENIRSLLWRDDGEPKRFVLTVRETPGRENTADSGLAEGSTFAGIKRTFTFTNAMVTGSSRDIPSDDVSSTSFDFEAEDLNVSESSQ